MLASAGSGSVVRARAGRRLLVVDDDRFYRDMASATLGAADYEVVVAADGTSGLEVLRTQAIDIAVIDLTMPGMDGFEVIRRARIEARNPSLPIIVITGQEDIASLEQAFEAGATSFLAKPLNWPLFVHNVNFVHRAGKAESDLRDAVRTVELLSNLKSKVLSVLVSEAQMPMKTAQGMAELLRREVHGPLGHPVYQDYAADLHRALEQLAATQIKMLNAGHALSSGLLLHEEPIGLTDVVKEVVESLRDKAARRAIDLEIRVNVPADVRVRGDRSLIAQSLRMLIDSSISYAPRRSAMAIDARMATDGTFSISVHDEAPSIPDTIVREILATAPSRPVEGGVPAAARNTSLTISRVLIEAHQGRMAIKSTPGEGTLVRLMLPKERLASASVDEAQANATGRPVPEPVAAAVGPAPKSVSYPAAVARILR